MHHTGITRIIKATYYSFSGLKAAWRTSPAFRQECLATLLLIPFLTVIPASSLEKIFMLFTVLQVLVIELLNSALETTVDRISTAYHELSGQAKDLGSAAVFLAIIISATTWLFIIIKNYF